MCALDYKPESRALSYLHLDEYPEPWIKTKPKLRNLTEIYYYYFYLNVVMIVTAIPVALYFLTAL